MVEKDRAIILKGGWDFTCTPVCDNLSETLLLIAYLWAAGRPKRCWNQRTGQICLLRNS